MRKIKKILSLTQADRTLLFQAVALMWTARIAVRWFGFQVLRGHLSRMNRHASHSRERIAWAVRVAGRTLPRTTQCLARALTEQALLQWSGHSADLRFGVMRDGARFRAHAWVTPDDSSKEFVPLNGSR